ncbi:MAG: phosphatidylserine decarboxylase [Oscillospiraceae bacterium]|nr:phosphatidylserine decarboxylase [Oscillospiraceae bacterium]
MISEEKITFRAVPILDENKASIKFLYNTVFGRILLKVIIKTTVSKLAGFILGSPVSRVFIKRFITQNGIKMDAYRNVNYSSFNDFFTREIKEGYRPFPADIGSLASPCDGKLTAYPISPDSVFRIKHSSYSIKDLLQDKSLADKYSGGTCLVFRLSPDDYHRYCFIDDAEILKHRYIKGVLHTVRPIAYQYHTVFCQNSREYTVMQTKHFGRIVQIEVGALFVGKISNHKKSSIVLRGEEKGMFKFGGSTIILLFVENAVTVDGKIMKNTALNRETIVRMGEKIGECS